MAIIDINLPRSDGFTICRQLRAVTRAPILFQSARDSSIDQVMGLTVGGDDYLTKPFSTDVMIARVQALLRRHGQIVSREELMEALWSDNTFVDENTLNVNVNRTRRALARLGMGEMIETRKGQGSRPKGNSAHPSTSMPVKLAVTLLEAMLAVPPERPKPIETTSIPCCTRCQGAVRFLRFIPPDDPVPASGFT